MRASAVTVRRSAAVLDSHCSRVGGTRALHSPRGESSVFGADGLGQLEGPDQLEPVEAPWVRDSSQWTPWSRA